ncbi:MAG: DUF2058 domain-containing protein [Gammaproteobacteria bacterium]|nr:DUF2058 domain-containing protein [Gammaproteobacteria bacterium]
MRNSLQDQLLKSGLVNEKKLKDANRAKSKQAKQAGKNAAQLDEERRLAAQALRDKADGDRILAQQRNAAAHQRELAAQIMQLVQHYRQSREGGDVPYNFSDRGIIKKLLVTARLRDQVIRGQLVIVRSGKHYELVPVTAGERIRSRDPEAIVVWNLPASDQPAADDPYKDFPIPDDLMW